MTPLLFVALSIAGGVGAIGRFVVDGALRQVIRIPYPIGTTIINVTGSFGLGLVSGLVLAGSAGIEWKAIIGTGVMGGYTTFSTASFETVRLVQERRWIAAAGNSIGMLIVSIAAATAGLWASGVL